MNNKHIVRLTDQERDELLKVIKSQVRVLGCFPEADVNGIQRGADGQMKIDDARCKLKSVFPKIKL